MRSIDIDVGGTFTDLVMHYDGKIVYAKSPTTPFDLSVCFVNVIEEGAKQLGFDMPVLLSEMEIIRYSTTIALNRLIQRQGSRMGLITTEGHEDAILIGNGPQWVDGTVVSERRNLAKQNKPLPLIPREFIVGAKERVDCFGQVVRPLDEEDLREKVRYLVDKGVRGFVVSLLWAFLNPDNEKRIRAIIREEYKPYHIGYLPVVLAHEVVGKWGEYQRTMTAVLDAYLHRSMQIELSASWDRLRENKYKGSFLMVHNTGGCAEVFKTAASKTYNGGPVSGLIGSYYIGKEIGFKNVVASDVGGTSFDIGLVVEESVRSYDFRPIIDTWMTATTMIKTTSIGAGGGSVAWLNRLLGNKLEVGPKSAGALPGPACYGLGGTEPTVTDADVALGYVNPEFYFEGKMKLDKELALRAIKRKIADPLGIDVYEAAGAIRKLVDSNMESAIKKEVHLRGYSPEDFVIFSFGGGGPTHVEGYMGDINKAVIFPFSPVFSAFGASIMDITHLYERTNTMFLMEPATGKYTDHYDDFNKVVEKLVEKAKRDLIAEGLPVDRAVFSLELDLLYGGQIHEKRSSSPRLFIKNQDDVKVICDEFEKEFRESFSPFAVNREGGVILRNFIVKVTIPTPKVKLPIYESAGPDPSAALKGSREAWWRDGGFRKTSIYNFDALRSGNLIEGPAVIEAKYTTIVVPPDMHYQVDEHGLGILHRV
jgi:N-methylhydantoinase A/acetophenone carboxylase